MKKIIALLMVALMLAPLMAACGPETPPAGSGVIGGGGGGASAGTTTAGNEETTEPQTTQLAPADDNCNLPEVQETELSIVKDGKSAFKIIYAAEMPSVGTYGGLNVYKEAAIKLAGKIEEKFGVVLQVTADQDAKASDRYSEILIGPTNREESDTAMMFCNGGRGYIIKAVNKKLVINALLSDITREAVDYFVENFVAKATNELTFKSENDYASAVTYANSKSTVAGYSYKTYTIVVPENPEYSTIRTAKRVQLLIANRIGAIPAIVYDNATGHNGDFEILVGATNRTSEESKKVGKLEYVIAVKQAKVEINAGSSWAFEYAAEYIEKSLIVELNKAKFDQGEIVRANVSQALASDGTVSAADKKGEIRLVVQNVWGWAEDSNMGVWGCAPVHYNSAAQRNLSMAELYLDLDADVIALQEYTPRLLRNETNFDISPIMDAAGYDQVYNSNGVFDSCTPIFYKRDKFELLETKIVDLIKKYGGQVGGDKFMTIAVLKTKDDEGKIFGVISIHKAYQGDEQANQDRYNMALDAVAEANAIMEKYGDCPVFVGGDFNCTPGSEPYKVYTSAGFSSAVSRSGDADSGRSYLNGPTWNANKAMFITDFGDASKGLSSESIDHIMVKGNGAGLVRYDILTDVVSASISDHLPQVLDFNLN